MGNDHSAPQDRNEAQSREEVLFTIAYTRYGPREDVYEENRKYTGRWGTHDANERLRFFKKVVAGAAGLQGPSQYRIRPPLAGFRVELTADNSFPGEAVTGPAPFTDLDGSQIFVGSTLYGEGVYPCKLGHTLSEGHCTFVLDGEEVCPTGNHRLLLVETTMMEWVPTRHGKIPPGRIPVDGGYEPDGSRLYHALVQHDNLSVPGKTGEHLRGMQFGFGGYHFVQEGYQILCWHNNVF